ncbi:hypothetical protein [Brevundimonas sp.]|uniref:hypothetical protein n=1 Tax=Brevundimonas sp. TaxID=1871086 RepID=UPI0028B1DBD7|nr:hypothetical protein [Brevundimonas sp.]
MSVPCNTGPLSEAYALAAIFANVERLDDSGEPNTLSLTEVASFGSRLLELFEGQPEDGDWAAAEHAAQQVAA